MKKCIKNNEWSDRRRTSKVPDDVLRIFRDYTNGELLGSAEVSGIKAILDELDLKDDGTIEIRITNTKEI